MWLLLASAALATDWSAALAAEAPEARARGYRAAATELPAAEALEIIAAALPHEDEAGVRGAGQDALARLALTQDELAAALGASEHAIARSWAAYALGHLPGDVALPALLAAVDDEDDAVRREVYDALGRLGDPDSLEALQRAAVRDPTATGRQRATNAALAVVKARDRVDLETQVALLAGGSREQKVAAAVALGHASDWRAVDALLNALVDVDVDVRRAAALALGTLGDQRAVSHLLEALAEAPSVLRYDLLAALARLGDESALEPVLALTAHDDPTTRRFALRAATWISGDACLAAVTPLAADPSEQVRTELVLLLEDRFRAPERVEPLAQVLNDDPSPFLRAEAGRVLIGIGGAEAGRALLAALGDRDPLVRVTAAEGVASLHLAEAVPTLEELVGSTRKDDEKAAYQAALDKLRAEG